MADVGRHRRLSIDGDTRIGKGKFIVNEIKRRNHVLRYVIFIFSIGGVKKKNNLTSNLLQIGQILTI